MSLKKGNREKCLEEKDSEDKKDTIKFSFRKANKAESCKKALRSLKQEISDDILSCCCVNS